MKGFLRALLAASPHKLAIGIFLYMITLVIFTDGFVWFSSVTLNGYNWKSLVLYSAFAHSLWTIVGVKGLAKEQVDLISSGRWFAIDLMPASASSLMLGHSVGQTIKTPAFIIWVAAFCVGSFILGIPAQLSALALCSVCVGMLNLNLISIVCILNSPKGYFGVVSSTVFSFMYVFTGAVIPLDMLSNSLWFKALNPFSAAVAGPVGLLVLGLEKKNAPADALPLIVGLAGAVIWAALLYMLSVWSERRRRAYIHS